LLDLLDGIEPSNQHRKEPRLAKEEETAVASHPVSMWSASCNEADGAWHGRCTRQKVDIVIDKIGFLVRFWELQARHATLGTPLGDREQLELLSLMQLVTSDVKMPEPGTCARPTNALPAQLIGEGTILTVELRYVCAAAILVASAKSMTPAERVIIRTADAISGVEYALPCSIAWVYDASPCILALVVDGIPTRSEFALMPEPRAGSVLSMGRQVRLVG
jgi:hypothetical protein